MTNKEHEIFMRKMFDEKLDEAFNRGCVNIVQKLTEYFTKHGITINVNNWMNDYTQGYDTVKESIEEFCMLAVKDNDGRIDDWNAGYLAALEDIMDFIERM